MEICKTTKVQQIVYQKQIESDGNIYWYDRAQAMHLFLTSHWHDISIKGSMYGKGIHTSLLRSLYNNEAAVIQRSHDHK